MTELAIYSEFRMPFFVICSALLLLSVLYLIFKNSRLKKSVKKFQEKSDSDQRLIQNLNIKIKELEDKNEVLQESVKSSEYQLMNVFDEVILANAESEKEKQKIIHTNDSYRHRMSELEKVNKKLEALSLITAKAENVVILMDKEGNFEWVNESFKRKFGYGIDDLVKNISKNIIGLNTPDYIKNKFWECVETKETVYYEQEVKTSYSESAWVHVTLTPVLNDNNEIIKLIAIDSDISELKYAEEKVKEKNRQILDSIYYAGSIQSAICPSENDVNKLFNNFILFMPKEIVSGDFFWIYETDKYKFIAVVDCTGHGVPGAMMSMLGNTLLNEIIRDRKNYNPSEILSELDVGVNSALNQESSKNIDGMDISICRIDKEITKTGKIKITFAGAKSSMFYVTFPKKRVTRIKGDLKNIGGYFTQDLNFNNYEFHLNKGDMIYLPTDGYLDQNSNYHIGRSFGTVAFMKLLKIISSRDLKYQKNKLESELRDFREGAKQLDDITIVGIRL